MSEEKEIHGINAALGNGNPADPITTIISDHIIRDYYTAGMRSEVILDTLLTPVLTRLLKKELSLPEDLTYVTKEFPLVKKIEMKYRNPKADYLLMDRNTFYLVELKTSGSSVLDSQLNEYRKILNERDGDKLLDDFCELFLHIFPSVRDEMPAPDADPLTMITCKLYRLMLHSEQEIPLPGEQELLTLMKKKKLSSSKKFLLQAYQLVRSRAYQTKGKTVRLIYIVPEAKNIERLLTEDQPPVLILDLSRLSPEDEDPYCLWLKQTILSPVFGTETPRRDAES